jgi:hypothetical protein
MDSFDFMSRDMPDEERAMAEEHRYRSSLAQGTAAHLAELLRRLTGGPHDEFQPLGVDDDGNITMTHDQGWLLYETALRSLPGCFAVNEGYAVDEKCQMPNGVCHACAAEGRSLPKDHPLRADEKDSQ